mgnify:CR=1 FL=1
MRVGTCGRGCVVIRRCALVIIALPAVRGIGEKGVDDGRADVLELLHGDHRQRRGQKHDVEAHVEVVLLVAIVAILENVK